MTDGVHAVCKRHDETAGGQARFNLSAWTLRHQPLAIFLMVVLTLAGVLASSRLGQSEDPPYTFRMMVVRTLWPGASARQMEEQISDRIARKLQETPGLDFLRSYSRPGESVVFFVLKDSASVANVQQTWYQVRKKVGDVAATLPVGVQGPYFNDEFGDVYTNLYTLQGDGFSPAQLHDYAEELRASLLNVSGVAKVDYFGDPGQHVYVEIPNALMAQFGVTPEQIGQAINTQNGITSAGIVTTGMDRVFVRPSGQYGGHRAIANTLLHTNGHTFRLGDIATISRGYDDPPVMQMRANGHAALGIGITMQPGADVVQLGKALDAKTQALQAELPAGLRLIQVSSMPDTVARSVDDFLKAVGEAVAIVLIVSLVSLGVRTGLIVVISIPVVLAVTALFMYLFDIGLHKVSLGTLVLSLGLLVDDAIIAVEMMTVKLEQGFSRARAAAFAYTSTAFPMLTGTLVTVSGFLPIALAKSSTGEYTRSIFEVSAIALVVSWFAAVVLIPLLGYHLLPAPRARSTHQARNQESIYNTRFYERLASGIAWCVGHRLAVIVTTVALFAAALAGFSFVPRQFFPSSDRPELLVDLRLPEGASFAATLREVKRLEKLLDGRPEIDHFVDYVGSGAPRFYLPLNQQLSTPNFAQFVINARSTADRERLALWLRPLLAERFSLTRTRVAPLENGPPVGFPVQFRVRGRDVAKVHEIAGRVAAIMRADGRTTNVQLDWNEPSERSLSYEIDQDKARDAGVTTEDISSFLAMTLSGYSVTQYREGDKLISVDLRAPKADREDPSHLADLSMPTPHGPVPLGALGKMKDTLEYGVIWERNRQPTLIVQSDTRGGAQPIDVTRALDRSLEPLRRTLPLGYHVEIGGSVEESSKGQAAIGAQIPLTIVIVLTLLMLQLQRFSRVLMVLLSAPLGMIGVVATLLVLGQPFGFVAMLGVIAMFGIIMRNSLILVDQIEQDIASGKPRDEAIVGATVRRFRPITLTAAAAVLGLIPLLHSNFFGPMAAALMGGISSATVLTIFFLPALCALSLRASRDERDGRSSSTIFGVDHEPVA